jgi:hypothetical protein
MSMPVVVGLNQPWLLRPGLLLFIPSLPPAPVVVIAGI